MMEMEDDAAGFSVAENGAGHDLSKRAKVFAIRIIRLYSSLGKGTVEQTLGKQVLRSGTSVGAHYHEAIRARSAKEFISQLNGGLQELSETAYWLELLVEAEVVPAKRLEGLQK